VQLHLGVKGVKVEGIFFILIVWYDVHIYLEGKILNLGLEYTLKKKLSALEIAVLVLT